MEYILIIILQLIGIGLHVMQKVLALDKLSPDDSLGDVFKLFWKADRITVFISGLVLALNLVAHFIVREYGPDSITEWEYYDMFSFGVALLLGYIGQRKIYDWLGKAESALDRKVNALAEK